MLLPITQIAMDIQFFIFLLICSIADHVCTDTSSIKLHPGHIPFVSNHHPELFDNKTNNRFKVS